MLAQQEIGRDTDGDRSKSNPQRRNADSFAHRFDWRNRSRRRRRSLRNRCGCIDCRKHASGSALGRGSRSGGTAQGGRWCRLGKNGQGRPWIDALRRWDRSRRCNSTRGAHEHGPCNYQCDSWLKPQTRHILFSLAQWGLPPIRTAPKPAQQIIHYKVAWTRNEVFFSVFCRFLTTQSYGIVTPKMFPAGA